MPKYVTIAKPKSEDWLDEPLLPDLQVYGDREPVDTGLVDSSGTPICRLPEPMGFRVKHDD